MIVEHINRNKNRLFTKRSDKTVFMHTPNLWRNCTNTLKCRCTKIRYTHALIPSTDLVIHGGQPCIRILGIFRRQDTIPRLCSSFGDHLDPLGNDLETRAELQDGIADLQFLGQGIIPFWHIRFLAHKKDRLAEEIGRRFLRRRMLDLSQRRLLSYQSNSTQHMPYHPPPFL
jgi:hypothetical protein